MKTIKILLALFVLSVLALYVAGKTTEKKEQPKPMAIDTNSTDKFLCNMIMEQHDFRNNVLRSMSTGNHEEAHETVKMKFPMLQGTAMHSLFRKVGDLANNKGNTSSIRRILDESQE